MVQPCRKGPYTQHQHIIIQTIGFVYLVSKIIWCCTNKYFWRSLTPEIGGLTNTQIHSLSHTSCCTITTAISSKIMHFNPTTRNTPKILTLTTSTTYFQCKPTTTTTIDYSTMLKHTPPYQVWEIIIVVMLEY